MASTKLTTKILLLNGTKAVWDQLASHVLSKGEPAIEFVDDVNVVDESSVITEQKLNAVKIKIGDGVTQFKDLPYVGDELKAEYLAKFASVEEDITNLKSDVAELQTTVSTLGNAVFEIEATSLTSVSGATEGDKIASYITANYPEKTVKEGNIAIVKSTLGGGNSYTAYVYNSTAWAAMDGNYDAENVYFSENITVTQTVGNVKTSNNTPVEMKVEGKNLKGVFEYLYATEDTTLSVTNPSVSLSVSSNVDAEAGSTFTRPTATLKVTGIGSYEYGSKDKSGNKYASSVTGVTFNNLKVGIADSTSTDIDDVEEGKKTVLSAGGYTNNQTAAYTATADDIASTTVADGTKSYYFVAEADHIASPYKPITNLSNFIKEQGGEATTSYDEGIGNISTNTLSKSATFSVSGYRKMFMGTTTTASPTINSDFIRSLNKVSARAAKSTQTITANAGDTMIIWAFPTSLTTATPTFNYKFFGEWKALSGVNKYSTTLEVQGANKYTAVPYTVYTYQPESGSFDATTETQIIIG